MHIIYLSSIHLFIQQKYFFFFLIFQFFKHSTASIWSYVRNMLFFIKKHFFFSAQPQCCWTFSWIELQILLRCSLIYIIIMKLRHFLCWVYLCQCLDLSLFMLYLCDLFFIFIMINHLILRVKACLLFYLSFWMCPVF